MPELPTAVVVPRRVVGLGTPDEPFAIDDEPYVVAGRNSSVSFVRREAVGHGSTVYVDDLRDRLNRRSDKRSRKVVHANLGPHRSHLVVEAVSDGSDRCLLEEGDDTRRAEHGDVTAPQGDCSVRCCDGQSCASGGADVDSHIGQTVPLQAQSEDENGGHT